MGRDSPLVRQWILLKRLSGRGPGVTLSELAAELEVSTKTIRRDLSVFQDAGFPVIEESVDYGRKLWRLESSAQELAFTFDEALALYLGRQYLEPLAGTLLWQAAQSAFRKIQSCLGPSALEYLGKINGAFHTTSLGWNDYSAHAEVIDRLMLGIEDRKVVFITYRSQRSTEPVTYDVHPYCLTRHRDTLYLLGFKPDDSGFRTWRVNRIEHVQVDAMPFTRQADFDADSYLAGSFGVYHESGEVRVRLRFTPDVARYVEESNWHPSQQCEGLSDGGLLVELTLAGTTELKSWVLSFGRHAEVLEPRSLRDEMQRELGAALARYQREGSESLEQVASGHEPTDAERS